MDGFIAAVARVRALHQQKQYAAAFSAVEQLHAAHPYSIVVLMMRAKLIQLLDDDEGGGGDASLDEARVALEQAHSLLPDNIEVAMEQGHFASAVLSDAATALSCFETARAAAEAALLEATVGKIRSLLELGEQALAQDEWREACRLFENDPELWEFEAEFVGGSNGDHGDAS